MRGGEDGVRGGGLSSNDLSNKNYQMEQPENMEGSIHIQNGPQQNGDLSQGNQGSLNDIPPFQRKKTDRQQNNQAEVSNSDSNNNVQNPPSERKIDTKPQINGNTVPNAANMLLKMRSKKSSVGDYRKQESLGNSLDELSVSRQKHQIFSTKPVRLNQSQDKAGKGKKKGENDIKWNQWDLSGALKKIFLDIDESDPKNPVVKNDDDTFQNATTVNAGKSIFSSSYMKHKDSRVSEGSESIGSKSANDLGILENNNNSLSKNDDSNVKSGGGDDKDKNNSTKVQAIMNEVFEKQPIEQEYIRIRKKEIQNLEKKGQNKVETDWSGDAVIPTSLSQKSQKSLNLMLNAINHTKYDIEQNEGGIIGIIQAIRRRMKYFSHTPFFENSIMICVIINTILLTLDGIVTDQSGLDTISQFNYTFTIIFAVDMGLKLIGEGFTEYVSDKMNIFDALIVCLSLFELIFISGSGSSFSAFRAVRILRVFRVLRVTRLIRSLQFMKLMITAIGSAISQFIYILLLLFLFMFIYTLLGMSLFGGSFNIANFTPRMNFDNFLNSAFAVLQLLTLENWNSLLLICIRSNVNNYLAAIYLISWMFIGNYVFMNLVLAIIMDSFDSAEVQEEKKDIENRFEVVEDLDLNHFSVGTTILGQTSNFGSSNYSNSMMKSQHSSFSGRKSQNDSQSLRSQTLKTDSQKDAEEEDHQKEEGENKNDDKNKQQFEYFVGVSCQKSLYLFSQDNLFRRLCYRTFKFPLFEQIILVAIILSSVKLTIDTYVNDQTSDIYIIGLGIDKFFTAFFTMEAVIKIVSLGFFLDDNSYLRDMWSQLDLFIVICSLIDVSVTSIDLSVIKILRLLRTLRPLRLLNHNKSMKLIVTALMESVGGITNMIIVVFLIWLMFAILALNLMKGKLNYCNFADDSIKYNIYEYHQEQCELYPDAVWDTYNINCDNIGSSMLFLFILSSFEGWPDYVFTFIDADESGPILNNSAYFAFYFAVFIFIGGFFSINLFSAIMAFNFDIAQKKAKNKYLSDQQAQWIELQRLILKSTPDFNSMKKPQNKFRFMLWRFVRSQQLEIFIVFCILCNIVTMAMAYDTSPTSYDERLNYLNLFFTAVFICECIIKIIAYGVGGYFFSGWNQFDFFVVCASIVDVVMAQMGKQVLSFLRAGPQLARVLRVMRVSRLLKLIKSFQNLQKLIQTTIFALPHLMNATALFLLFYFIFAILGCYLFSSVTDGRKIDQFNNFNNFHSAFIILFRCSTGEDWMTIMFDVTQRTTSFAVIYFVCFIITQTYIMMNLFVLIIINQFEENYIDPDNPLQNFREQEESFKSLWVIMTEKENGVKIHERFLTDFYFELKEPLGYGTQFVFAQTVKYYNSKKRQFIENLKLHNKGIKEEEIQIRCDKFKVKQKQEADKRIMQMNIFCDYDGFIFFNELFFFFFKFSLYDKINDMENIKNQQQLEKQMKGLQILRKEENITLKKMNYIKKKQSQLMKQKVNKKRKEGVNPMVRRLFVGMCLKGWLQYSRVMQKKINDMNFNEEDISSESDTDSNDEDLQNQSDFLKNDEEEVVQFRQSIKKNIISREHTIFTRVNGLPEKNPSNLIEKEKYIFLPNTEIYKDDYIQMGENDNYYSQRVFSNAPSHKDSLFLQQDTKQSIPNQNGAGVKVFLQQPTNQSVETPINFKNKDNSPISLSQTNIPKESRFKHVIQQKRSIENDIENNLLSEESQPLQGNNNEQNSQSKSQNDSSEDQQKLKDESVKSQNGISLQKLPSNLVSINDLDHNQKVNNNVLPLQKIIINRNKDD